MTILTTGAYDLPAAADRQRNSMMLAAGAGTMGVIDGVHSGMKLSKTTGMGFSIGSGRAAVNGETDYDGTFSVAFTSSVTGSFADGDASKDRIDRIVIQTDQTKTSTDAASVVVVKGTAATSPVAPATPDGALELFDVRILAGTNAGNGGWSTSKITDKRRKIGVPEYIDYTPTFGGFDNLGSGAIREGRYRVDGDKVSLNVHLNGGSGGSMGIGNALYFTLPIPAASPWIYYGTGGLMHSTGIYDLKVVSGGTTAIMWAVTSAGKVAQPGTMSYPFDSNTDIWCNMEYIIDIP
jgi:hypothetical protein